MVEKPASIVKELVENSIDAGATKINIQVFDGGISKIIVSDNGSGILPEDLRPAFLPHATSKILTENDLYNIATLGFRGEALASIASVSQVEVISKTSETNGHSIKLSGGEVVVEGEKGSPMGTYICVENLFFNTPARQKFLKKPKKEESDITSLVSKLILANPRKAIKYTADNKVIYSSTGQGLKEAIFAIYGSSVLDNLIPLEYENGKYKITGYIGKTSYFKPNRTYQTIMINNRWVADSIVNVAISQSYESYMMKHCFPFCVVNLTVPNDEVDVNVHPSKLEVRFQDAKAIFGFVYHAVTEAIYSDLTKKTTEETEVKEPTFELKRAPETQNLNYQNKQENTSEQSKSNELNLDFILNSPVETNELHDSADSVLSEIIIEKFASMPTSTNVETNVDTDISEPIYVPKPIQQQLITKENENNNDMLSSQIIGKAFNTFVIMESGDNLYFIDQHAAHERLLFDKYVKQIKDKNISCQPLLIPYTINVNSAEEQFLLDNLEMLKSLGFEIYEFGNLSFRITAIPSSLPNLNVENFFKNFLSNLNNYKQLKNIDLIRDELAETACKHAVKGGDDLDKEELIKLVKDVGNGDVTLQCPHGRPFVVKFTRREIDKWFRRIV